VARIEQIAATRQPYCCDWVDADDYRHQTASE